jgi:tryptophan halogenase
VEFIQEKIIDKITLIKSEMVSFTRDSQNNIVSLELKNGTSISGDLFLDCTGFNNLLQHQPIKVNLADRLICDTAIAVQIPYQDKLQEQKPYVICDAVDHGWIWTIPVKTRMGSGLVFNRSITSIEEAKNYLSDYWDGRADVDKMKVIDWTPFYNENVWHENVISIGLSAGFLEPLESTGIALIMEGIYQLAERISDLNYSENDKIIYNSIMKEFFESSINFVSMHYSYTERSEPFWLAVKDRIKVNQEQQLYIDILKNKNLPLSGIAKRTNFFTANNWNTWLIQMGYEVTPRNIKDSEFYLNKWYDNDEKFRHQFGVVHLDYLERNQYLFEKYSKFK